MSKVPKVVTVHKEDSKPDVSIYRPISVSSNISIVEKLRCYRIYKFSMTTSFIIYNLVSDNSFFFSYSINLIEEIRNNLDKGNIGYYFY